MKIRLFVTGRAYHHASALPRELELHDKATLREALAVVAERWARLRGRSRWDHPSPTVWPPPVTYSEVRQAAGRLLPGSRFDRKVLWRYTIAWRKPADEG